MASDQDITKCMEKELSCTLCLDLYKNPMMLPCLHSFCFTCLEEFLKAKPSAKNILRCPICRIGVDLTSTGLNYLQKNFQLASIVDIYRQIRGESVTNHQPKPVHKPEPEVGNDEDDDDDMPPILPLPSNIVDGHLTQPNLFYIDSDAESTDDEETWNAEFSTMNQDFNFLWIGTLRDLQHIRLPVWNPPSSTTDTQTTRTTDETSQQLSPTRLRRNALIRNLGSNNLQSSSALLPRPRPRSVLSTQSVQSGHISQSQPTRKRSKIVNFFRKHFTR